jgi:hypothetical protein
MNWKQLKKPVLYAIAPLALIAAAFISNGSKNKSTAYSCAVPTESACVMKTIFGLDGAAGDTNLFSPSPEVNKAVKLGSEWITGAQGNDGGWGAGSYYNQEIMDPHAVPSDPATTSIVGMALLRSDSTNENGDLSNVLQKATEFLLKAIENCPDNQPYITRLENTQPQVKLGRNIDVILTAQYFTNLLHYQQNNQELKKRIDKALGKCIGRIQKGQDKDGSWKDGGWAPVLQSALANNVLETAQGLGVFVDSGVLKKSQKYQNENFDVNTKSAVTDKSAGVVLYSISSTARASANEAKKAKDIVAKAKKEGKIKDEKITEENLIAAGTSVTSAKGYVTAYSINSSANQEALRGDVMDGFGSNGGEEYLSYLMTGESMVIQGGEDWKKWYEMMTGKLVKIQNQDGSWQGHHCITSPVFCTAACLLILSIHRDMQFALKLHQ